ncbi:ankyrin repeat ph and sec7 domain containing protein secg-related [Anaeramoeba flamelloides]|uniref:Ankyrin repeat ph and sec7 domain containing protein secg-related n=1 Tax=Anaeramoeba flamelloides TaxID=1746091 RepID=A0AAV7YDY9_9EUKA|nr:ankyrin repeat ph and sec7 domain containing protein secg-related [Anaeramoeba flamelloides]
MSAELEKRINEFHKITKKSLKFSLEYLNKHSFDLDESLRSFLKPKEEEMIGSHFLTLVCQDDRKVNIGTLYFNDPKTGLSPLHLSTNLCRLGMVELLLSNGSNPWFFDNEGMLSNNVTKSYKCKTLIRLKQKGVESNIISTIGLLKLLEGGDLNSIDKKTVHQMFHRLATFDSTRIYEHQTIIKTSGIINIFDSYGFKLIHRAIEYNNFSLVEFLLKTNKNEIHEKTKLVALTNCKTKKNNKEDKKKEIEETEEEEEDNNKRKNKSPLQIAIENGNLLIVALLLINGANEKIIKKEKINDPFIKYLLNCFEQNKNQSKFSYGKKVVVRRVWTNLSETGVLQLKNKTLGQFITSNQFDNLVNWYGIFIDFNENFIPTICSVHEYIEGVSLKKLINKLKTQKAQNKEDTGKKNENENINENENQKEIEIEMETEEGEGEGEGKEETEFTLQNLFKIACEILKTARFMALNSIFHNNLKPEKIIINRNCTPKIIYTGKIGSSKYYFQRQTTTSSSIFPIYYSIEKFLRWSQETQTIIHNDNGTDGGDDKSSNSCDSNSSYSGGNNNALFKYDYYSKDFLNFDIKYSTIEEQFQLLKLKKLSEQNKKNLIFLIYLNGFLQFIKENPRNIPSIELKIAQLYSTLSYLDINTDEPSDFLGVLFQCSIDPEELECGEDFDSDLFITTIEDVFFSENNNENEFEF